MSNIKSQLQAVHNRIIDAKRQYGRNSHDIQVIAVSKKQNVNKIQEVIDEGLFAFGENYLQEAIAKIENFSHPTLEWHFIGPIQSNKTAQIARHFHWAHTVDRPQIAKKLNNARPPQLPPLNICLQINTSGETNKSGLALSAIDDIVCLVKLIDSLPHLQLRGLMTIPAPTSDIVQQRQPFKALRQLNDTLSEQRGKLLDTLSMGMSNDLEAAIAEGATIIRIGSAIFGARQ